MLFAFGKFWQSIVIMAAVWVFYLFFGFEFTLVSVGGAMLSWMITRDVVL
jgi:hypothetical protein